MLSSIDKDLLCKFKAYDSAQTVWQVLKMKFDETSATKLHGLTMRFDLYKMHSNHVMKQHLRVMSNMIHELKTKENNLTDKQQVQTVI